MRLFRVNAKTPATWEAVLEEFLLHQQAQGKAPRTVYDYRAWVNRFFRSFPRAWGDYETLRRSVLEHFARLGSMAPATFNLARKYLKVFFAWCVQEGYLPANPVDGIRKRKEEGRPRSIPLEVLKKLLSLPDKNTYTGIRDTALILLQVDTGLRPQEALLLTPSCFNLKMLEVAVPFHVAKTREGRTVVISPQTAKAIQKLLSLRPPDWTEEVPVFASQDGRPMLETSWAHRLRAYSKRLGVKITPYSLRHTAAIESLRNGGNVFYVQRQLGHSSLVMTKRYLHLVEADLHREHAKASPVANLFPSRTRVRKAKREE